MLEIEQKQLEINETNLLYLVIDDIKWYPINYTYNKFIGNNKYISMKDLKNKIEIRKFDVKFPFAKDDYENIQETNCTNKDGICYILSNLNKNTIDKDNLNRVNALFDYFGLDTICNNTYTNEFIEDIINGVKRKNTKYKFCTKCNREFPVNDAFFYKDTRNSTGYGSLCRECAGNNGKYVHKDKYLQEIYYKYGLDMYINAKNWTLVDRWYEYFVNNYVKPYDNLTTKNKQMELLKRLMDKDILNKDNMIVDYIQKNILNRTVIKFKLSEIYDYKYPDWRERYYDYMNIKYSFSDKDSYKILNNYIIEYNINIDNIYNFDYTTLFKNARVYANAKDNELEYIMNFYNNKYISYKFNITGVNYYKNKNNRIKAFKDYIKELGIKYPDIPLHVTKYAMRKHSNTLYTLLNKYYDGKISSWANECYPNEFKEDEFCINNAREYYDSIEEKEIDKILKDNINDGMVLYVGSDNRKFILKEKLHPDWVLVKDNKTVIVEYWGMYNDTITGNIVTDQYMQSYNKKVEIYKNSIRDDIQYYYLFLYPDDLKNNNKGILDKLELINSTDERIIGLK